MKERYKEKVSARKSKSGRGPKEMAKKQQQREREKDIGREGNKIK